MESHRPNADAPGRQQRLDNVRAVHEAGVPVGAGTDTQGAKMRFGSSLHQELFLLVEAGLTPSDALQAAARNAARALNAEKTVGTIEAGKLADVIIVQGDPTKTIQAVADVQLVIQQGRILVDRRSTP